MIRYDMIRMMDKVRDKVKGFGYGGYSKTGVEGVRIVTMNIMA